jgi:hypothetical protein
VITYMAHTLTDADQSLRPGLTGEAAHDEVCGWLGFHSGPVLTDGIPDLASMYLHLAGILRDELPEFSCATPGRRSWWRAGNGNPRPPASSTLPRQTGCRRHCRRRRSARSTTATSPWLPRSPQI